MRSPEALFTQYRTVFRAVTRKAISYIVNSNGKEVEQVVLERLAEGGLVNKISVLTPNSPKYLLPSQ